MKLLNISASARRRLATLIVAVVVVAGSLPSRSDTTNAAPAAATNAAAPAKPSLTLTYMVSDDDSSDDDAGKHHVTKHDGHKDESWMGDMFVALLIPLAGVICTFGMPVAIVLVVMYFQFRRRRETLDTVRQFLDKGMPVPPELLAGSGKDVGKLIASRTGRNCDLSRGFKLTFIGLGVALALYVHEPHSTMWGWGLIPFVMGIGYLISGWVQGPDRAERPNDTPPPGGNPPTKL